MKTTWYMCLIIFTSAGIAQNDAASWSYKGDSGPENWHQVFPEECSGKQQSPIDIRVEETIYNPHLKDFAIWYDPPKPDSKMYIRNNGHTVQVDLEGDFYVTNGGLQHEYKSLQFHFHWGHKEHVGSEHLFDGQPSPIELHLVSYNYELFSSISEAVVSKGGLAVLGVMYEISDEDNPNLATIVRALKHIRDPELHPKIELPLVSLRDLLPEDLSRYFRYNGSLTTPGCFESVIWTVFQEKQTISRAQLREFTTLLQHKHKKSKDSRHRRSLSKHERKLERRAEDVLDELGIRGNKYEESILKSELIYMQMMADQPADDTHLIEKEDHDNDKQDKSDNEDETTHHPDAADNEEHVPNDKDHSTEHRTEHKGYTIEGEESEYVQEVMVDNFRPVQPLNDRIVYRSFKLRTPPSIEEDIEEDTEITVIESQQSSKHENGATSYKISLSAIATMFAFVLVFV